MFTTKGYKAVQTADKGLVNRKQFKYFFGERSKFLLFGALSIYKVSILGAKFCTESYFSLGVVTLTALKQ